MSSSIFTTQYTIYPISELTFPLIRHSIIINITLDQLCFLCCFVELAKSSQFLKKYSFCVTYSEQVNFQYPSSNIYHSCRPAKMVLFETFSLRIQMQRCLFKKMTCLVFNISFAYEDSQAARKYESHFGKNDNVSFTDDNCQFYYSTNCLSIA